MTETPHVVILGGGFGGLSTATEIRNSLSSDQVKITVIDKKDWFMVGFAKLWILNGSRTFENSIGSLKELEKKDINFVKDEITSIDLENKNVKTSTQSISYDYLLISLGAVLAPEKIPGLVEHGFNLYDHNQLLEIRNKLENIESGKIAISISRNSRPGLAMLTPSRESMKPKIFGRLDPKCSPISLTKVSTPGPTITW